MESQLLTKLAKILDTIQGTSRNFRKINKNYYNYHEKTPKTMVWTTLWWLFVHFLVLAVCFLLLLLDTYCTHCLWMFIVCLALWLLENFLLRSQKQIKNTRTIYVRMNFQVTLSLSFPLFLLHFLSFFSRYLFSFLPHSLSHFSLFLSF